MIDNISNAAKFNMPYGDKRFKQAIERALGRSIGFSKRGRPAKEK